MCLEPEKKDLIIVKDFVNGGRLQVIFFAFLQR